MTVGTLAVVAITVAFAALVFAVFRDGVVPAPLVAGASAQLLFLGIAAMSALSYTVAVAVSIGSRRLT